MALRAKRLIKTVFVIYAMAAMAGLLDAAWAQAQNIPVHPNSKETKQETRRIRGAELKFTYYASSLSMPQIKDFYRKKLIRRF